MILEKYYFQLIIVRCPWRKQGKLPEWVKGDNTDINIGVIWGMKSFFEVPHRWGMIDCVE